MRELLLSLSKDKGDFIVQPFKGSGNGGQKKNKTMSACRITHPDSGAVSECQEERSYEQNKKKAFTRLVNSETFQKWYKLETARRLGTLVPIEKAVEEAMNPKNIKTEVIEDGKWVEVKEIIREE